jgi:hypothetical protein
MLIAGLLVYPILAFVGSVPLGVFVFRYAIPVVVGLDLAFVGLLAWGSFRSRTVAVTAIVFLFSFALVKQNGPLRRSLHGFRPTLVQQFQSQPWIRYACTSDLPVLTGSLAYNVWQHYAPACLASRLYFAPDPQRAQPITGEVNLALFSRMVPLKIVDFDKFARQHHRFLVVDAQWLESYLASSPRSNQFKITSQRQFPSSYNDDKGVTPLDLKVETVQER